MNRVVFTFGLIIMLLVTFVLFSSTASACTEFLIKTTNEQCIVGRSMEFGIDLQSEIVIQPRNTTFQMPDIQNTPGIKWSNKFGYAYLNAHQSDIVTDGMNEKGLSFGSLYLPAYTQYPTANKSQASKAIPNDLFGHWILGNFESVTDIKKQMNDIVVYGRVVPWAGIEFPLHYSIYDKNGQGIVIEFTKDGMTIYDNTIGVLTNAPTFAWHLNNLQNHMNLTPYNPPNETVSNHTIKPAGQGFGMLGLPGDYTPPSRLIRILALRSAATPAQDADQGAALALHLLNTVDIPAGVARPAKDEKQTNFDTTEWIVIKDLHNLKLYYRTYSSISVQMIDLSKLDFSEQAAVQKMPLNTKPIVIDQTWQLINSPTLKSTPTGK